MWNSQLVHIAFYAYKIWLQSIYMYYMPYGAVSWCAILYTRHYTNESTSCRQQTAHTHAKCGWCFFFILEMKWNGTKFGVPSLFRGCGGVALAHQLNVNTQRKKLHAIIAIRAFFPLNCVILFNNIRTAWALGGQSKFAVVHLKVSYFIRSFLNFL